MGKDLDKIRAHYAGLATLELKRLGNDYADMREDTLPLLFEELTKRGEVQFVQNIKLQMNPNDPEVLKEMAEGLPIVETFTNSSFEEEQPLDEETTRALFTYTQTEILDLVYSKVMKDKANIKNWLALKEMIQAKWDFSDGQYDVLRAKLDRKRKRANLYLGVFVFLTLAGMALFFVSDGGVRFLPGFLFIIVAIISFNTSRHLGRILKSSNELQDIL